MLMTEKIKQLIVRSKRARENVQEKARLSQEADKLERNAWEICQALEKELCKEIAESGIPLIRGNCVVRVGQESYLLRKSTQDAVEVHEITIQE